MAEDQLDQLPGSIKHPEAERHVPDRETIDRLLDHVPTERHQLAVLLMADAGLRVSEAANARVEDIDLATGTIAVVGKGAKRRTAPITTRRLRKALAKRMKDGDGWLIRGRCGPRLTPGAIRRATVRACERRSLPRITPHALRHSFSAHFAGNVRIVL